MERLVLLLLETGAADALPSAAADIYAVAVGDAAHTEALAAVESLRDNLDGLSIIQHTGGGSFKSQLKKADKSGARVALIWGEDEVSSGTVAVKRLREDDTRDGNAGQQTVPREQLEATLQAVFAQ